MPLKHHTETALMLILGIVIALTGFVCGLLPAFPAGIFYWCIAFAVTTLYPIVLASFFRANRADYEFRLLHWVPVGMTVLWLFLELLSYRFEIAHTAQLGFFVLWSLPLVALGIGLAIVFSAHVIRRRTVRIGFLAILLLLFAFTAYASQMNKWNPTLQAALFPQTDVSSIASNGYKSVVGLLSTFHFPSMSSGSESSSSSVALSSAPSSMMAGVTSSDSSSSSSTMSAMSSDAATTVAAIATVKTRRLTKTGPEDILGFLALILLAGYCMVLHARARSRIGVEWAA